MARERFRRSPECGGLIVVGVMAVSWAVVMSPGRRGSCGQRGTGVPSFVNDRTGQVVDYLLPRTTNIRRIFVDETGQRPVLWVGSNHGASIVKVEPLD